MSADEVVIGLISAPGTATEVASNLADDLRPELSVQLPTVQWRVSTVVDVLVHPPADDAALVAAARERLLKEAWDLVVCLTDLPLRARRRPVVAHASPLHGVAVVCLPALGAVGLRRRTRDAVVGLVRTLLGDTEDHALSGSVAGLGRRARELGSQQEGRRQRHVHCEGPERELATTGRNDPGQPAVEACDRTLESTDRRPGNRSLRARHRRHLATGRRAWLDQTFGDRGGLCRRVPPPPDGRGGPVGTGVESGPRKESTLFN